jgi:hypothetical protein
VGRTRVEGYYISLHPSLDAPPERMDTHPDDGRELDRLLAVIKQVFGPHIKEEADHE